MVRVYFLAPAEYARLICTVLCRLEGEHCLLTKTASAYLMSIIPTLFFLGVISIITVCTGNSVISELSSYVPQNMPRNTCIKSRFSGLIAICCGNNAQLRAYVRCGLRRLIRFPQSSSKALLWVVLTAFMSAFSKTALS